MVFGKSLEMIDIYAWPVSQSVKSITDNVCYGLLLGFVFLLTMSWLSFSFVERPFLKQKKFFNKVPISITEK